MKSERIKILVPILLILIMLLSFSFTAFAEDQQYTQKTAVQYILDMEGKEIQADSNGSLDCVDIAKAYFRDVGGKPVGSLLRTCGSSNAYNYADPISNSLIPDGWVRKYYSDGYIPQPGDVAVWGANVGIAGPSGHVAVVSEVKKDENTFSIKYLDQSTGAQKPAEISKEYLNADNPTCYIVPVFNQVKSEKEILDSDSRFTVLVLDNSEPINFTFHADIFSFRWKDSTYTSNSSVDEVKKAAHSFLEEITDFENNYVAIVKYSDTAEIVTGFTNDIDKLNLLLDSITESESGGSNINAGLGCADELLLKIANKYAVKNIVLCTTGVALSGDYNYHGKYSEDDPTVPANWQNTDTEIRIYATANTAIATADKIKNEGTTIYTLGVFSPIEDVLPNDGKILTEFFRRTARDIASSEKSYYPIEDTEEIVYSFEKMEEEIDGREEVRIYTNGEKYTLFDKQLSSLVFSTKSTEYNPELSYMLMNLAWSAYNDGSDSIKNNLLEHTNIYRSYESLGLQDIQLYNYYDDPNDPKYGNDNVAFTLGWRELPNSKKMIVLTIRGSYGEFMDSQDWKSNLNLGESLYNGAFHKGFNIASDKVVKALEEYSNSIASGNIVYVVTGHSRGAAVANLVSYKLMKKGVKGNNLYDYNFACPDVARSIPLDWNPFGRFNNIFNINNCSDIVGNIPGTLGSIIGLVGSSHVQKFSNDIMVYGSSNAFSWEQLTMSWGKFGNSYWFSKNWDDPVSLDLSAHDPQNYKDYLSKLASVSSFKGWYDMQMKRLLNNDFQGLTLGFLCPVDVVISAPDGHMIASVQDEIISYGDKSEFGKVIVLTQGDRKIFYFKDYDEVNVSLEGNDTGEMTYFYTELNLYDETATGGDVYQNVQLERGKKITSTVKKSELSKTSLYVVDENEKKTAEVEKNGDENKVYDINTHLIVSCLAGILFIALILLIIVVFKKTKTNDEE